MSPVIELEKPKLVQSDGVVALSRETSVTISADAFAGSVDVQYFVLGEVIPLNGEDYPALVAAWDNDDDAIYDQI